MAPDTTSLSPDSMLRNWLLHRLAQPQAQALEQRVLLEEEFAACVEDAEYDLLDDYARNRLAESERVAVETWLLATGTGRERLRAARAFAQIRATEENASAASTPPAVKPDASRSVDVAAAGRTPSSDRGARRRWSRWAGAIAAAVAIAVLFGSRIERNKVHAPAATALPTPPSSIAHLTLLASTERGVGQVRAVTIPLAATAIRLQVEVERPEAHARYEVTIADGEQIVFTAPDLGLRHAGPYAFVEVVAPVRLLAPGLQRITLARQGSAQPPSSWSVRLSRSD